MTVLHQNIIVDPNNTEAKYQLRSLPKYGILMLNGIEMKTGGIWTQADVIAGNFQYVQTKALNPYATSVQDKFTFVIPLATGGILLPSTPRSPCLPTTIIPPNGIFTFNIDIVTIPKPTEIRNNDITIMEDASQCLSRNNLFYSSDSDQINAYFNNQALPVEASSAEIFGRWERFSGDTLYPNPKSVPSTDSSSKWEFRPGNRNIAMVGEPTVFNGVSSQTQNDSYLLEATFSGPNNSSGEFMGIIAANVQSGGIPYSIVIGRSIGTETWGVYEVVGNTRTLLVDMSGSAPASTQTWATSGRTRVQVKRVGTTITAVTSQFSGIDSAGNANATLPLDPATTISYTLATPYDVSSAYGFGSETQGLVEDMSFADIPAVNPPSDPQADDPLWERFPIIYNVLSISPSLNAKGEYRLIGSPLKIGDTFTHRDLDEGKLCVYGSNIGKGDVTFSFNATVEGPIYNKSTYGRFTTHIEPWPYAETENSSATINECNQFRPLTDSEMYYFAPFGSTDAQITITLNPTLTAAANTSGTQRVRISPTSFTQQDVIDGNVLIMHECGEDPTLWNETLVFDVCTNHGKCNTKRFQVKIIPLPIVLPPQDPTEVTLESGCTYKKKPNGSLELIKCGVWAELSGRLIPDPETKDEGDIIHIPSTKPPMTMIVEKDKKGKKHWVELPTTIPNPPSSDPTCENSTLAPNTSKPMTSTLQFVISGTLEENKTITYEVSVDGTKMTLPAKGVIAYNKVADTPVSGVKDVDRTVKIELSKALKKGFNIDIEQKFDGNNTQSPITISGVVINGKKYNLTKIANGNTQDDLSEVKFSANTKTTARVKLDKLQEPKVRGQKNKCFTGPDGTKWVSDSTGEWSPVDKDPATVDQTPIILTGEYVVQVDKLSDVPKDDKPQYVYVKNKDVVMVLQEDETYAPAGSPFSEQFDRPPFTWVGPNEFWLPYGFRFVCTFFANRMYVRVDIQDNGVKSAKKVGEDSGAKFFSPYNMIGAGYGATTMNQVTIPVTTYQADLPSGGNNPYETGAYYLEFGNNNIASFCAAIRPVKVDKKAWAENTNNIFSYSGYGSALRQKRANVNTSGKGKANADGGAQYGTYIPFLHNELWSHYGNTNYTPAVQYLGWQVARLRMVAAGNYGFGGQVDPAPYSGTPPKSNYTLSFNVKATDITSGEVINRTYKIHWNKDGLSPNGLSSEITDLASITPDGVNPPKPGIAICKYLGDGSIGNCTFKD